MRSPAIEKYLSVYAEPEAGQVVWPATYETAVVVPAVDETPLFPRLMRSIAHAARAAGVRPLVILVVNSRDSHPDNVQKANAALLELVGGKGEAQFNARYLEVDLIGIDRTTPGRRFPEKQGVGLARRIGCDIALGGIAAGKIVDPLIRTTDGDVEVPEDYFAPLRHLRVGGFGTLPVSAVIYDFDHRLNLSIPDEARALRLYDRHLHHYEEGLRAAGSPYAFATLGSTIAVTAEAYARVRGFPRREAAEDFYLLNKLAQVGQIHRSLSAPLVIHQRTSTRVPFGTGASVKKLQAAGAQYIMSYAPESFRLLKAWLDCLNQVIETRTFAFESLDPRLQRPLITLGAPEAIAIALATRPERDSLRHHLHCWFDSLRTLRLIHLLRAEGLPDVPLLD
jgi:hypothetical protein